MIYLYIYIIPRHSMGLVYLPMSGIDVWPSDVDKSQAQTPESGSIVRQDMNLPPAKPGLAAQDA